MTGNAVRLGRILGVETNLDYSWFLVFLLVTWSLASHYFPMVHPGWPPGLYWGVGVLTSVLFFSSVVTHELAHGMVSRANGMPVRNITLFIFGGVAHLSQEPRRARDEFLMALAGPATSLALAGGFGAVWWLTQGRNEPLQALAGWLAGINVALGLFNLIPGFPLDGGRMFRAVAWSVTGNLQQATVIAAALGRFVAFSFIFWGALQVIDGNWADGLWIAFIGWFLFSAASQSTQEMALKQLVAGRTVREIIMTDCPQVSRRLTLDVLVDQFVTPNGRRCFPVIEAGSLAGLVTLERIASAPRDRWTTSRAWDVMIAPPDLKTARLDDELSEVLERMASEDMNQFPVMDGGQYVGMVARDGLLNFIRLQMEFGIQKQAT